MWFVYILLCQDGSFYTGATNNIEKRFLDHQSGKGGKYTRSHKPVKLIYSEKFTTQSEALKREIKIKSWDRSKKIKELGLMTK
jgi:putative endonuclease